MQAANLQARAPNKTCTRTGTTGLPSHRGAQSRPAVKCQAKKNATGFKWDGECLQPAQRQHLMNI
eukprot:1159103-Pelagomonas_calceolata.AAC.2